MLPTNDPLTSALKAVGQSLTKARRTVFDQLALEGPLTMNELVNRCLKVADRATVYRVVKLYEELGIVSRIQIGWKYKLELSEKFSAHHHHLSCVVCSKIIDVEPPETVELVIKDLAQRYRFQIKSHQLDIAGVCYECQQKDPREGPPDR